MLWLTGLLLKNVSRNKAKVFLGAIKPLAKKADLYDTCLDVKLVTRIIAGISNKGVREQLLATSEFPTLAVTVDV